MCRDLRFVFVSDARLCKSGAVWLSTNLQQVPYCVRVYMRAPKCWRIPYFSLSCWSSASKSMCERGLPLIVLQGSPRWVAKILGDQTWILLSTGLLLSSHPQSPGRISQKSSSILGSSGTYTIRILESNIQGFYFLDPPRPLGTQT